MGAGVYTLSMRALASTMRALAAAGAVLLCASVAAQSPAPAPAESRPSFADWLGGVRAEAVERGIAPDIVDAALDGVTEPLPVVLERDRAQAEAVLSLESYIRTRVSPTRVRRGRIAYGRYRATLEKVSAEYGVPSRIIAGIWGMESNFGTFSGVRPTVSALATLAWDPRRATYFRGELFSALEILGRRDIELSRLRGSWAGAMGQPQFMPSSYLEYAQDFDGDGRRDIWGTPADVFASIANYLRGKGWTRGLAWGREVKLSKDAAAHVAAGMARREGSCRAIRDMTVAMPLDQWRKLGVRSFDGGPLPQSDEPASLVSGTSRTFLVYRNYDALLDYNCANAYALSVVFLGERIARAAGTTGGRP
jgi:membrane-bound lytic murein transglycosylase B